MYQKKNENPINKMPDFKILIPKDTHIQALLLGHLGDLRLTNVPKQEVLNVPSVCYLTCVNGVVGYGSGFNIYLQSKLQEFTVAELLSYKAVPLQLTKLEIESLLGHQIEIIEEIDK